MQLLWCSLVQCFSKYNVPLRILLKCRICFNRLDWALRFCISSKLSGDSYATCQGPCSEKQGLNQHSPQFVSPNFEIACEKRLLYQKWRVVFSLGFCWTLAPKKSLTKEANAVLFYCGKKNPHIMISTPLNF